MERSSACDCSTSSLSSLSLISPNGDVFGRKMTMRSVMTEVSSPTISLTGTAGLSEICSRGMGFQCLMMREPEMSVKNDYLFPLHSLFCSSSLLLTSCRVGHLLGVAQALQRRLHNLTPGRCSCNDHIAIGLNVGSPLPGLACVNGQGGVQRVH